MKNAPNQIYLNIGIDHEDFKDLQGVTWSENQINDTDIQYTSRKAFIDYVNSLDLGLKDKYLIKGVYYGFINSK